MTTTGRVDEYYKKLYKLMWAMVWEFANHDRWLLQPDEIFGDLSLELVKVVGINIDKPDSELKNILIVSLRNRCIDLVTMAYNSHRSAEASMLSLSNAGDDPDDDVIINGIPSHPGPEDMLNIEDFIASLSDDARILVNEVLHPGDRMIAQLDLSVMRKISTSPKGCWTLKMTPLIAQRALGWNRDRILCAWEEVKTALL